MATCCRQLCPRITSCSGWPVSGHGERNALSSPLTFRSLYFLFHSARSWLGRMGGLRGRGRGDPGWRVRGDRRGGWQGTPAQQKHQTHTSVTTWTWCLSAITTSHILQQDTNRYKVRNSKSRFGNVRCCWCEDIKDTHLDLDSSQQLKT